MKVEQLEQGQGNVWENVPRNAGLEVRVSVRYQVRGRWGWAGAVSCQVLCPFKGFSDPYQQRIRELPRMC